MNTENEIYSLASCPGTKYSGDSIVLKATPRDGIGPYYVAFKNNGIIIDSSRLGAQPNPITNAAENVEITRTYTLDDTDVRNALTGTIDFSVFIRGSCPTGGGLQFDGVNDYVNVGNNASLNITDVITISAWIKTSEVGSRSQQIIDKLQANTNTAYRMWLNNSNNVGIIVYPITPIQTISASVIPLNTWIHIIGIYDSSSLKIYVNGVLDASTTGTGNILTANSNLLIGKNVDYTTNNFNGTIDEIRIYNRALSPTEILGLYNGSTPRNGMVLEHIYSLGNANDLSGYGNNGTPINGPIFIPNACMDICTVAIGCIAPVCNFVVT